MNSAEHTIAILSTISSISYANLINVYFLTWFLLPALSHIIKPLPVLNKAINTYNDEEWRLSLLCYCFGDFLLSFSEGQDIPLMIGMSAFICGHMIYLRRDKYFITNYLLYFSLVLVATTGLDIGTRALLSTYFPVLIRCLTLAQQQDRDRVLGWMLFLASDVLLAHSMISGTNYGKVPLFMYWLSIDLL